ncbi:rhamnan synthesis F family protein [Anaerocolumna jejuensis]|uniref:rhamnan synthesis F family protein n=1 Tax=Anaerocolumna jejuensis TaxID=259063 RepID=UPI003F7BF601
MKIGKNFKEKHLGLFVLKESTYEIEEYLLYLIEQLSKFFNNNLYIITNQINDSDLLKIQPYLKEKNIQNGLYKEVFNEINSGGINQLVIFDDTFFGPLFDLSEMFNIMEQRNVDYWTIDSCEQPYFISMNSNIFKKNQELLEEIICLSTKGIPKVYEYMVINTRLSKDTYIKFFNSDGVKVDLELSYEAIAVQRCPFVKIDAFTYFSVYNNSIENARNTYEHIHKNTEYKTGLIWKHLLRHNNILQIKKALHLEYILPWTCENAPCSNSILKKTAVIIHLHYLELIDYSFQYIKKIPHEITIFITTSSDVMKECLVKLVSEEGLFNCHIIKKINRGRDISSLLVTSRDAIKKYEYIGFIHDKNFHKGEGEVRTQADFFRYNLWENTLKSSEYIKNILNLFVENPDLGLLCPPQPYSGRFIRTLENSWYKNYTNTVELLKKLNVKCTLNDEYGSLTLGSVFWCRTEALRPLFNFEFRYDDFMEEPMDLDGTISHAIERAFCYVAQGCGFYTGIVMNTDFASLRSSYLQETTANLLKGSLIYGNEIKLFCKSKLHIYMYGMGEYGRKCLSYLIRNQIELSGVVVSEGKKQADTWYGYAIYEINEIRIDHSVGIILAVGKRNKEEIMPNLLSKGCDCVFEYNGLEI